MPTPDAPARSAQPSSEPGAHRRATRSGPDEAPAPGGPAATTAAGQKALGAFRRGTARPEEEPPATDAGVSPDPAPVVPAVTGGRSGPVGGGTAAPTGPPPAPRPPASAPATGSFPTRDELVQAWGDHVIGRLRPKAKALFQAGRFVGVDGERAVFGLPNETHRNRCEEVRGEIETALSEQFGRAVGLELVVDPGAEPTRSRPGSLPGEPPMRSGAPRPPGPSSPSDPPAAGATTDGSGRVPLAGSATDLGEEPDDQDDLSVFDEAELGEVVVDVDNSAEARVLQAFPGAEEVG